jgi:hypothetical protein
MKRYLYDMGTDNYTVNGNDISSIWNDFQEVLHISVEQQDTSTAADRRDFAVDYTAKTLLVSTRVQHRVDRDRPGRRDRVADGVRLLIHEGGTL